MKEVKALAVIPARGGSQGISQKNIKPFEGKPLIAWTIECAKAVDEIDRIIVSTDNVEIAEISKAYGAEVPFLRPKELAEAETPIEPVMAHVCKWLQDNEGIVPQAMVLLFATCPIREPRHIREALALFYSTGADSVVSVNESPAHYTPYWTLIREEGGRVCYFGGTDIRMGYARRQDFPRICYAKNDVAIVFQPRNLFADVPSLFGERVELYVTERIYDADINTPEDWEWTEMVFRYLHHRKKGEKIK
jgi:N-acylneuraminate cytidylyltransferase/CMP-N,N'-diacetyllegionaminic acid synthase